MSDLAFLAYTDLTGITRGRARPDRGDLANGVGWVPADQSITPFGSIGEGNPFGPLGDLRIKPDGEGHEFPGGLRIYHCSAYTPEGEPWAACPRHALTAAVDELGSRHGLRLKVSFEHEFTVLDDARGDVPSFSLRAFARWSWRDQLVTAVSAAGIELENLLPEYGSNQFEITVAPTDPSGAADQAVTVRELVRHVAFANGSRATFSPVVVPGAVGNGVHIHLSLHDANGPCTAGDQAGGLSERATRFVAGAVGHLRTLTGFTAPSAISGLRLVPHHWSSAFTVSGVSNREATVRICPGSPSATNIEFRAADATASPHLALAAIVRAGLDGLDRGLTDIKLVDRDPSDLTDAERASRGIEPLPTDAGERLSLTEGTDWFPPLLRETYRDIKRTEYAEVAELDDVERCRRYADVY